MAKFPIIEANLIVCHLPFRTKEKKKKRLVLTFYLIKYDRKIFCMSYIERKQYCHFFLLFHTFFFCLILYYVGK